MKKILSLICLGLLVLVSGCNSEDPAFVIEPEVTPDATITVTPFTGSVLSGTTQQFKAYQVDETGLVIDVTDIATWSSSIPSAASVNGHGLVEAHASGDVIISAKVGKATGQSSLNIHSKSISSLTVSPASHILIAGLTAQYHAQLNFSDGTTQDITKDAHWLSQNPSVASVSSEGLVTAIVSDTSPVEINASYGSETSKSYVEVVPALPTSLVLQPGVASIYTNTEQQYRALLKLDDGSVINVTNQVMWSSSNDKVASISNNSSRHGIARGVSSGSVAIKGSINGGGYFLESTATLTVNSVVLTALTVSPSAIEVVKGAYGHLSATAHFSDGHTLDVSSFTGWSADNTDIALVGTGDFLPGYGYALEPGSANIIAKFAGQSVSIPVTVTNEILQSIEITPITQHVVAGSRTEYEAIGIYSNGTKHLITAGASWTISDQKDKDGNAATNIATVDSQSPGGVFGITEGSASVDVSFHGVTAKAQIKIEAPVVYPYTITPLDSEVYLGGGQIYTAHLSLPNGNSQNVSYDSYWFSSDPGVLSFASGGSINGQYVGKSKGVGSVIVTAKYSDGSHQYEADTTFTVTDAIVDGLTINNARNSAISGQVIELKATVETSDGNSHDGTSSVAWTSSDPNVASINAYGVIHSISAGTTEIKAQEGVYFKTFVLRVYDKEALDNISLTCDKAVISSAGQTQCNAIGTFDSGDSSDITTQVIWSSTEQNVAVVDNYFDRAGSVHGVGPGSTLINASLNGVTSPDFQLTVN